MNKGAPADSPRLVREVRFFPAPPEILKDRLLRVGFWCARRHRSGSSIALRSRPARCRWRWTWPAARGGRQRRAGQALALQVVVDVAGCSRRPPAARWPGAGAAGGSGRGQQVAAAAGGALARCSRCRWWWAGLAPVRQGAVIEVCGSRRWPARLPACSKRGDVTARACRAAVDRKKTGKGGPALLLQNYYSTLDKPNVYAALRPVGFAVNYAARY